MFRKSISTVLILSISLAILAGIGGLVLYVAESSRRLAQDLETQAMVQFADQTAKMLDHQLASTKSLASTVAGLNEMRSALSGDEPRKVQPLFISILRGHDGVWAAFAFNVRGEVVAGIAKGEGSIGDELGDRDYVQAVRKGANTFQSPAIRKDDSSGEEVWAYAVAAAVRDQQGRIVGGVCLLIRWDTFTAKFLDPVRFGAHGYPFMADAAGKVIAHAVDKSLLLKDLDAEVAPKVLAMDRGSLLC